MNFFIFRIYLEQPLKICIKGYKILKYRLFPLTCNLTLATFSIPTTDIKIVQ